MKVELLYIAGCPNHAALAARLRELLADAGRDERIELRRVVSEEDARRLRFPGSPTVRIDGRDVEPGAEDREDWGIRCRLYRSPDGLEGRPADELIVSALTADRR